MKRLLTMGLACVSLVVLTACQKTPESPIIVGKGDAALEQAIEQKSNTSDTKYEAPAHWVDKTEQDNLFVTVDADVIVPVVRKFSTAVLTTDEVSQETADKLMGIFLQGATLYETRPDYPYTKDEITKELLIIKQSISDPNSDFNTVLQKGTDEYEASLAEKQEQMQSLEKLYESAPESVESKPADTQFHEVYRPENVAPMEIPEDATEEERKEYEEKNKIAQQQEATSLEITGEAVLDNGLKSQIFVTKTDAVFHTWASGTTELPESAEGAKGYDVPELESGVTEQQARDTAIQVVKEMGLAHLDIAECDLKYIIERGVDGMATAKRPCYSITFSRSIGGITENIATPKEILSKPPQYIQTVEHETATVMVAKEGIIGFEWRQPMKVIDTIAENIELLTFENIQSVFKKSIVMNYAYLDSTAWERPVTDRRIVIEKAKLGFMRVLRQGKDGEYLMIPVWDFYGYDALKFDDPGAAQEIQIELNEDGEYIDAEPHRSYLTINAIDGSVIDRYMGY